MGFELENIVRERQNEGRITNNRKRAEKAAICHSTPGESPLKPSAQVWECRDKIGYDVCRFSCAKNVGLLSFTVVTDLCMLEWLDSHKLMDSACNKKKLRRKLLSSCIRQRCWFKV